MERDEPETPTEVPGSDDIAEDDSRDAPPASSEPDVENRQPQKDTAEVGDIITPDSPAHNSQPDEVGPCLGAS